MSANEIKEVLLVGGMTRMPKVRLRVRRLRCVKTVAGASHTLGEGSCTFGNVQLAELYCLAWEGSIDGLQTSPAGRWARS